MPKFLLIGVYTDSEAMETYPGEGGEPQFQRWAETREADTPPEAVRYALEDADPSLVIAGVVQMVDPTGSGDPEPQVVA